MKQVLNNSLYYYLYIDRNIFIYLIEIDYIEKVMVNNTLNNIIELINLSKNTISYNNIKAFIDYNFNGNKLYLDQDDKLYFDIDFSINSTSYNEVLILYYVLQGTGIHNNTSTIDINSCITYRYNIIPYSRSNLENELSFNILELDNGHFAAQPNNRTLFYDKSLTPSEPKQPDFKVSTVEYAVESVSKWTAGDDTNYFYNFLEQK